MNRYYLGVYKRDTPFPEDVTSKVLHIVAKNIPSFFPAKFHTGKKKYEILNTPDSFKRGFIPAEYWFKSGACVNIPIYSNAGFELSILDNRKPAHLPASVLLFWNDVESLPKVEALAGLLSELANTLGADDGFITDEETRDDEKIDKRAFKIDPKKDILAAFWLTWLGPQQVANLNKESITELTQRGLLKKAGDGMLLQLLPEPYSNDNPEHLSLRKEVEKILGIA